MAPEEKSEESQEAEFELPVESRNDDVVPVKTSEESQEAEFEFPVGSRNGGVEDVVQDVDSSSSLEDDYQEPVATGWQPIYFTDDSLSELEYHSLIGKYICCRYILIDIYYHYF